jgi:L-rhamnose mutarotase
MNESPIAAQGTPIRKQRVAFMLRLRPGMEEAYDESHRAVWPEMLALLKRAGISEYSIFRRDQLLVLAMTVEDFDVSWAIVENDPVNTRWQSAMAPYFEATSGLREGERFPMMREVFYLA